jgi:hypothetical protein
MTLRPINYETKKVFLTGEKIEVAYIGNETSWRKTIYQVYKDKNGMLYHTELGLTQEMIPAKTNSLKHADLSEYDEAFPYHPNGGYKNN